MKVAIFTYKDLKELLNKPSEDATRKWVDSRGLKRRNRENSNVKEVLVPYETYKKIWELAGRPPEFSNPPTEDIQDYHKETTFVDENVINAEFSTYNSEEIPAENYKTSYALSTEFAEEFIKELAARQDVLMDKNEALYNKISELTKFEEKSSILEKEVNKKEDMISNYQNKIEQLYDKTKEIEVLKVKIDYIKEINDYKDKEILELKEKLDKLNSFNKELETKISIEKNNKPWYKKLLEFTGNSGKNV